MRRPADPREQVAAALRAQGRHVEAVDGGLRVFEPAGAVLDTLRIEEEYWTLEAAQQSHGAPVLRVLGRVDSLHVHQVVNRLELALVLRGVGDSLSPSAGGPTATKTLANLLAHLTLPAGLGGPVEARLGGSSPYVAMATAYGLVAVRVLQGRVAVDFLNDIGELVRAVVGVPGRPERDMARSLIGALSAIANPRRGCPSYPLAIEGLAGVLAPLGAFLSEDGPSPVVVIPDSAEFAGTVIHDYCGLAIAPGRTGVEIFGCFGEYRWAAIAEEIAFRLHRTHAEREQAAQAWDEQAPPLLDRVRALAEDGQGGGQVAWLSTRAQAVQGELNALQADGSISALERAERLVDDLEATAVGGRSSSNRPRPAQRFIRQWAEAEQCAAEWMEWFGLGTARLTGGSADGGVDVECDLALGQVKDYGKPLPAGPVREIYAIAAVAGKRAVIFARAGFTADAISWGDQAGVAMFAFDLQGEPEPVSQSAHALMGNEA